jgi:cytochrome b561
MDTPRYDPVARLLHWMIAAVVLPAIPLGFIMLKLPPGAWMDTAFDLHRSLGALLLVLMPLRLLWRLTHRPPQPVPMPPLQALAARTVHLALYGLLLVMPWLGWWGTSAYGAPITVFWLFDLPPLVARDEAAASILLRLHSLIGWLIALLVCLHIAAVLYHIWWIRDALIRRMYWGRNCG